MTHVAAAEEHVQLLVSQMEAAAAAAAQRESQSQEAQLV